MSYMSPLVVDTLNDWYEEYLGVSAVWGLIFLPHPCLFVDSFIT